MTENEAIRHLEDLQRLYLGNEKFTADIEAIGIAIKALEQQPCEDCISRQALIEKATSWDKHFADSERCVSLTDIQNAPSVTPQLKMISTEKLEEITEILVNGIFRDDEIMYCEMPLVEYDGKRYDLRDIVATLHNYLYEAVEGKRYNYMFHWANKVLADCDDDVFEEDKE